MEGGGYTTEQCSIVDFEDVRDAVFATCFDGVEVGLTEGVYLLAGVTIIRVEPAKL